MSKDRETIHPAARTREVQIVFRRSSHRPIEYAILLQVRTRQGWRTIASADNSHADRNVDEHHWHRYLRGEKQPSEPLPFEVSSTNDAMWRILDWFSNDWPELISD